MFLIKGEKMCIGNLESVLGIVILLVVVYNVFKLNQTFRMITNIKQLKEERDELAKKIADIKE